MHYDDNFEREILEASVNIRNEHKAGNIEQVFTEADLSTYLSNVNKLKVDKLKTDYIIGDITEDELLEGITPHKAHADLVEGYPTSEVGNLITDPWHPLFSGIDEDFADILDNIRNPLKDSTGKSEDARYCYIGDIAKVALDHKYGMCNTMYEHYTLLGEYLDIIVASVIDSNIPNAQYYCSEALNEVMEHINISQVIGVRADALSSGKYELEGYREEIDVNLLLDAAARHFLKILFEDEIDNESGFRHEAHIAANMIMIHTQLGLHK